MTFDAAAVRQWNLEIAREFRANEGRVGGMFEGRPMLILTTVGAKSGKPHETPLVYQPDGERMYIFASKAGHDSHPAWYHNLLAHPEVTLEVGTETFKARATVVEGEERERVYQRQVATMPQFAEYQAKTTRVIPVIALDRIRS